MKKFTSVIVALTLTVALHGQHKYIAKQGYISFYSQTPLEDIQAELSDAGSIINTENGEVIVSLKMRSFDFEKKLMQEHFNENYVESDIYPKSMFKGYIINNSQVDYNKDGSYQITIEGDLTIHGKTNKISTKGSIVIEGGELNAETSFIVKPADYNIKIPRIVRNNIAKEVQVTAKIRFEKME